MMPMSIPLPSAPLLLFPVAQNWLLSDFKPRVCCMPATTLTHSLSLPICTGLFLCKIVESPNCPLLLYPHAQRVPSDFKPMVYELPAAMLTHLLSLFPVCTGLFLCVVVPSPNAPL